ncbi:helix-turn-helix domain-containing protein [Stakelama pacifica]|uniref:XRE family transcriptional regulator n=1 Tax=Stakelama pacifica TaxID=517720 RepID=A0A4R6FAT8_9SPHN|nr:XRE family transcriptional regulator [Stakelama pacifica]TDN78261.1 XRE family transcriptional regulator [Stakelama pacifica]GGO99773.1 transcriptional regulator [Stakelama pacifica]
MPEKSTSATSIARPGDVLKALRAEKGWTLQEVSRRTGMPISTLSKIEHGKMSLTYDKITRLSRGLEVDIERLFASSPHPDPSAPIRLPAGRRSVSRSGEGTLMESDVYSSLYPAADLLAKKLLPIVTEVKVRSLAEFGPLLRHSGDEYSYVVEGAIELHTDLYAPLRLEVGDSVYFDSTTPHAYIAAAPGTCKLVTVCSADSAELRTELEASVQFSNTEPKIGRGGRTG